MRSEIKRITSALAMTSIFVTHDQEEAMSMSDRILVIHEGKIAGELDHEEATQEKIITLATGGQ